MGPVAWFVTTLLDVVYPERCYLCGAGRGEAPWAPAGPRVRGLRFWDTPDLCRPCSSGLGLSPAGGRVGDTDAGRLEVVAAGSTGPDLVKLVGGFKYHGLRGLAWPLAALLKAPLDLARNRTPVDALVPIPLHGRRRRTRGFNQTEILASILAFETGLPVLGKVLRRHRDTGQQAKIDSAEARRRNLAGSFRARGPAADGGSSGPAAGRVGLVDDLVTSGWTTVAAAAALRSAGWEVPWVLTLGLAAKPRNSTRRVDTWGDGF